VPGGGDGEEEEEAGKGSEAAPEVELAGVEEEDEGGRDDEDDGDEALGEDGQGQGCPHGVGPEEMRRRWGFCGGNGSKKCGGMERVEVLRLRATRFTQDENYIINN